MIIRAHFGLERNPFAAETVQLLEPQTEVLDTLLVHCQQGGLCLVLGEPGTGKSTIKDALAAHDQRNLIVPVLSRTLHTYRNILRILCQAFAVDFSADVFHCEKRLIEETFRLNQLGRMVAPILDDAHYIEIECLRRLRLLMEDFPKNHNLILVGQPALLRTVNLAVNAEIKSRVTYSTILRRLAPDALKAFLLDQLEQAGLGHNVFSEEALDLVVRSADGVIRKARNLALASLLEVARDRKRTVDIKHVNQVLVQPHWRSEIDVEEY